MRTDWRMSRVAAIRALIQRADPKVIEEMKWRKPSNPDGVPTFSCNGIICTLETYRDKVKMTFAHGASLPDPLGIFNASLDAGIRRAIDLRENDVLNEKGLMALIQAAIAFNRS